MPKNTAQNNKEIIETLSDRNREIVKEHELRLEALEHKAGISR